MRQERRPYLMRARQTEVIPCRKLSGGGILELIKKIRQACPTIKKQKLKTLYWDHKTLKKKYKHYIREDHLVHDETGDMLWELIKIVGQSLWTKKLVHIFGPWDTRWPPKRLGWRQSWNFALSDRFQVNIRQTSIRLGGGFVLRLLDALNLRDCWASSAGKFHAYMKCFQDPQV